MLTPRQDLVVQAGETWVHSYAWKVAGAAVDLTGYTAQAHIRSAFDGTNIKELSQDDGSIVLGGSSGVITLALSADETLALHETLLPGPWDFNDDATYRRGGSLSRAYEPCLETRPERAVDMWLYDVDVTSAAGVVTRVMQGRFVLIPSARSSSWR